MESAAVPKTCEVHLSAHQPYNSLQPPLPLFGSRRLDSAGVAPPGDTVGHQPLGCCCKFWPTQTTSCQKVDRFNSGHSLFLTLPSGGDDTGHTVKHLQAITIAKWGMRLLYVQRLFACFENGLGRNYQRVSVSSGTNARPPQFSSVSGYDY